MKILCAIVLAAFSTHCFGMFASTDEADRTENRLELAGMMRRARQLTAADVKNVKKRELQARFAGLDAARGAPEISLKPEPEQAVPVNNLEASMLAGEVVFPMTLAALILWFTKLSLFRLARDRAAILAAIVPLKIVWLNKGPAKPSRRRGGSLEDFMRQISMKHDSAILQKRK